MFFIDTRRVLEDCEASIRKAQRINRGEIGDLVGYMSALTHDLMIRALEVWRETSPGIVIDCIEMDTLTQERALVEERIAVGIWSGSDQRAAAKISARNVIFRDLAPEDKAWVPVGAWKPDALRLG